MIVVGLVGHMHSGKTSAAKYLEEHGYCRISLSGFLVAEARRKSLEPSRRNLQNLGNAMRKKLGGSVLVRLALAEAERRGASRLVIDGLRNPAEADEVHRVGGLVIGIVGPKRDPLRPVEEDEKERAALERESSLEEPAWGQRVADALRDADTVIDNSSSLDALYHRVAGELMAREGVR